MVMPVVRLQLFRILCFVFAMPIRCREPHDDNLQFGKNKHIPHIWVITHIFTLLCNSRQTHRRSRCSSTPRTVRNLLVRFKVNVSTSNLVFDFCLRPPGRCFVAQVRFQTVSVDGCLPLFRCFLDDINNRTLPIMIKGPLHFKTNFGDTDPGRVGSNTHTA